MKMLNVRPWGKTAFELGGYFKAAQVHKESGCPHVGFLSFGCISDLHKKIKLSKEEYKDYASDICFASTISEERRKVLEELVSFIGKGKT